MKHIVHTDADGYVISLELTQAKERIELKENTKTS